MVRETDGRHMRRGGLEMEKNMANYYDQENNDVEMDFPPWSINKENDPDLQYMADGYRDYKDSGFESPREDDESPSRKTRIPVALRRLRERGADKSASRATEDGSRSVDGQGVPHGPHADDWRNYDERDATIKPGETRRIRSVKGKSPEVGPKGDMMGPKVGPRVCPHCNRTFAVVTKEGVYVAFSIARGPLVVLLFLAILLALAPYAYPYITKLIRRCKILFVPPPPDPPKPSRKGSWLFG